MKKCNFFKVFAKNKLKFGQSLRPPVTYFGFSGEFFFYEYAFLNIFFIENIIFYFCEVFLNNQLKFKQWLWWPVLLFGLSDNFLYK